MKAPAIWMFGLALSGLAFGDQTSNPPGITVRTEMFPRPPYSGATYYIYERAGKTICTKLEVCNKFNECETSYFKGLFKDGDDIEAGTPPRSSTGATPIPAEKLVKHTCLTKFNLVKKPDSEN